MGKPTYEESLKFFRTHPQQWEAIIEGITAARDRKFSDLKRNMNTPNCNDAADYKAIGYMIALDDLAYEFAEKDPVSELEPEV